MSAFGLLVMLALLVGYFMSIAVLVDIAQEKGGYKDGAGILWAIGILTTPITLGLCVCALPDKRLRELAAANGSSTDSPATGQDDLPSV